MPHLRQHAADTASTAGRKMSALLPLCLLLTALGIVARAAGATVPAQEWVARSNGTGNAADAANHVAVDTAGNVYVTGSSAGSNGHTDFLTVKYDGATGEQLWASRYDGPANGDDRPVGLGVDGAGNVFVAGRSTGPEPTFPSITRIDYATIKYDGATGQQLWASRYSFPIGDSVPTALAVDGAGSAYVTGYIFNRGAFATVKYDGATGQQLWVRQYNGGMNANNLYNLPAAIAVDGQGDVYIGGSQVWRDPTVPATRLYALMVALKYSGATGQQLWANASAPRSFTSDNIVAGLALDASGNAYVTGTFYEFGGVASSILTTKYAAATGQPLWTATYGSTNFAQAMNMTADAGGNVIVTGTVGNGTLPVTVKFAGDTGSPVWTAATSNALQAVGVDGAGDVYVAGYSGPDGARADFDTVKYAGATGERLWEVGYNGPGNAGDVPAALVVDGAGNLYVTGSSAGVGTGTDFATVKYRQNTPTLTDVAVSNITTTGATLVWNTSARATSQVEYGTTAAYGATQADGAYVSAHNVPISGLKAGTPYYFRVSSELVDGTVLGPVTGSFTTLAAAPTITWGSPSPAPNAAGWNNTPVDLPFTISPADAGSVDPASPLHFTTEGAGQTRQVTVTDAGGMRYVFTSPAVNLDFTGPATTVSVSGPAGSNGWYTGPVTVTLAATDALSGVDQTSYRLDGGTAQNYSAPFTVSGDGFHTVTFWSVDRAGNTDGTKSVMLGLDSTSPTMQWGTPTPAPNAAGWNNTAVDVPFTVNDALSGVASTNPATPLHLTAEGTSVAGTVTGTDAAGNTATFTSPAVKIDRTAPHTSATVFGAGGQNGWYVRPVVVGLEAADILSGVAATNYQVDGGPVQSFTSNFTLAALGTHQLRFWSVDRAGNTESAQSLTLRLEPAGPVVTIRAMPSSPNAPDNRTARVNVSGVVFNTQAGLDPQQTRYTVADRTGGLLASGPVTLDRHGRYHFALPLLGPARAGAPLPYVITVQAQDRAGAQGRASALVKVR